MLRVVYIFLMFAICIHAQDLGEQPKQYQEFYKMCGSVDTPPRQCDCADGSKWRITTGGNIDVCNPVQCTCQGGRKVDITMFGCAKGGRVV